MKITLIGLGISKGDITLRAKEALDNAKLIIARTAHCEGYKSLAEYKVKTLDFVYEKSRNFDTLNKNLASEVLNSAKTADVCYCVDGSVCENEACRIILAKHKDCEVLDSVSKASYAYGGAKLRSGAVCSVSAYSIADLKPCKAVCVYDIDNEFIAGNVKERLSYLFGEESSCIFSAGGSVKKIKIYELDRQKNYGVDCSVAVEEKEFLQKERYDYCDLEELIRMLRAPGGCPWDREQTAASIKGNMIEEAYELVDAIERDDPDGMEEETGDVLLQSAFHAVLAEERGDFTGGDALTRVVKKLIFRHSHIFGKDKAESGADALTVWEKNKRVEKGQDTFSESVLAVPQNFPSCMFAQKVQKRASKSGMDFLSAVSASERLLDEVNELIEALVGKDADAVKEEAGDVMFSAVNVVRKAGADSEESLRASTLKFIKRFCECERLIIADGKNMTDLNELELDVYWQRAKEVLKG